jgi:hypothetical protein
MRGRCLVNDKWTEFFSIIKQNEDLMKVFDALDKLAITNYYVGAGAIAQSIWNYKTGKDINFGISDIDIVYFDPTNNSKEQESKLRESLKDILGDFPLWLDIKNQARVHLWYKEKFGYDILPYESLEAAINTWPTTATAIGVRKIKEDWVIYAPFGLKDVMNLRVIANSRSITEEIYMNKVMKWKVKWPELDFLEWEDKIVPIVNQNAFNIKGSI